MGLNTPGSLSDVLNRAFRVFRTQAVDVRSTMYPEASFQQLVVVSSGITCNPLRAVWSRRWLLDPESMQFAGITNGSNQGSQPELSLVGFALIVREFGCVDVVVGEDMACLSIRSALTFADGASAKPLELVVDGQLRALRTLPSGMSSSIVKRSAGDYEAVFSDGGQSLDVDYVVIEARGARIPVRGDIDETKGTRNEQARGVHRQQDGKCTGSGELLTLRRITLSLALEQRLGAAVPPREAALHEVFVVVQGVISDATCRLPRQCTGEQGAALSVLDMPTVHRCALYKSLQWTPLMEMQAEYVETE